MKATWRRVKTDGEWRDVEGGSLEEMAFKAAAVLDDEMTPEARSSLRDLFARRRRPTEHEEDNRVDTTHWGIDLIVDEKVECCLVKKLMGAEL